MSSENDLSRPRLTGQRLYGCEHVVNSRPLRRVLHELRTAVPARSFERVQFVLLTHPLGEPEGTDTALLHHREVQPAQARRDQVLEKTGVLVRAARVYSHERSTPGALEEDQQRLWVPVVRDVSLDTAAAV